MFIRACVLVFFSCALLACNQAKIGGTRQALSEQNQDQQPKGPFIGLRGDTLWPLEKTREEWKAELPEEVFHILWEAGTEFAFTGAYWDNEKEGEYVCAACGLPLFSSRTKFKSATGWPSFYEPINPANIWEKMDYSGGVRRVEVRCARCGGHQGHVFDDGPKPTGLRYCINSASLKFVPAR